MLESIFLQFLDSLWRESGAIPLEITLPPDLARALFRTLNSRSDALPTEAITMTWNTPYGPIQITAPSLV